MYRVLYRKWRPQTFDDVVGQEHITSTLVHELELGRVSHAYLFTGSRGTGKTTCAKILAKAINCLNPVNGSPCNKCEICKGIDNGSVLDIIEIDAASNNGVDSIRDLREESNFTPVNAKYRVYIIDEVHMLSIGAFNALLKTLEEPPEHVKFILATTEVNKLPATILSRCQRFDFHRIAPEKIADRLKFVAKEEHISLSDDAALLIAGISDGAMRDALSILDRCIGTDGEITAEVVSDCVGLAGKKHLFDFADKILKNETSEALELIMTLHSQSCNIENLLSDMINHFRNLMIVKTVKNPFGMIVCTEADMNLYKIQADKFILSKILFSLEILEETASKIKNSVSKKTELEMACVKLCNEKSFSNDNSSLIKRIEAIEKNYDSETEKKEKIIKTNEVKKEAAAVTKETAFSTEIPFEKWNDVLNILSQTDIPLHAIIKNSTAFIKDDFILIKCDNSSFPQFIRIKIHIIALKEAIEKVTGKKYRLGIYKSDAAVLKKQDPLVNLMDKINNLN